jgi:hypothetical protein
MARLRPKDKPDVNLEMRVRATREPANTSSLGSRGNNEMLIERRHAHGFRQAKDLADVTRGVRAPLPPLQAPFARPWRNAHSGAHGARATGGGPSVHSFASRWR